MAGVKIAIAGLEKVLDAAKKLDERMEKAAEAGVYGLGQEVMTDSKQRVPVDLGALKGSGYVTMPVRDGRSVKVELGYGGPAKDYAVVQHEKTELRHPDGGEAKYLENAINAASGSAARRITEIARRAFNASAGATRGTAPTNPDSGQRGGGRSGEG